MRKLKIYDGKTPDPTIDLRLVSNGRGGVTIVVVDHGFHKYGGYLLTINADGYIETPNNISSKHGFPLDSEGRLKLRKA